MSKKSKINNLDFAFIDAGDKIMQMKRLIRKYNSSRNRLSHVALIVKFNSLYFKAYEAILFADGEIKRMETRYRPRVIMPVISPKESLINILEHAREMNHKRSEERIIA